MTTLMWLKSCNTPHLYTNKYFKLFFGECSYCILYLQILSVLEFSLTFSPALTNSISFHTSTV